MRARVGVGVFGLDGEGSALAARLAELPHADLRWLGDPTLQSPNGRFRLPQTRFTDDLQDLLDDGAVEAVVLATSDGERAEHARRALEAGKHVLVHEPLAARAADAEDLVRLAVQRDRRLLVATPLLFHPAIRKLKELVELGRLGEVYYLTSERQRLDDGDAIAALAAGGVSLALYLFGDAPVDVQAWGDAYREPSVTDVASCRLTFMTGVTALVHVSQLDPRPGHRVTVVGSKRTAVFDELDSVRPLTIYDCVKRGGSPCLGDIHSPRLVPGDAYRLACEYFLAAVRSKELNLADLRRGVGVAVTLEALRKALESSKEAQDTAPEPPPQVIPLPVRRRARP